MVGDTIVGVHVADGTVASTEAQDYDAVVGALVDALAADAGQITLSLKRILPRGYAVVTAVQTDGEEFDFLAFEGENLRMGLIRNLGKEYINDQSASRYDNKPVGTGDCGGNGLCCTCVVSVLGGQQHLSERRASEKQLLRNRARWRQSCRAYLRLDDGVEANVRIQLSPRGQADLL